MSVTLTSVPRKTLAEQLDRFDSILDGLADAIPETIDEAVRQSLADIARDAVRSAITEVLTDPTVLARIREAGTPQPSARRARSVVPICRQTSPLQLDLDEVRLNCCRTRVCLVRVLRCLAAWPCRLFRSACRWHRSALAVLGCFVVLALIGVVLGPLATAPAADAFAFSVSLAAAVMAAKLGPEPAE